MGHPQTPFMIYKVFFQKKRKSLSEITRATEMPLATKPDDPRLIPESTQKRAGSVKLSSDHHTQ